MKCQIKYILIFKCLLNYFDFSRVGLFKVGKLLIIPSRKTPTLAHHVHLKLSNSCRFFRSM
jgi:hypothetical protein